MDNRYSIFMQVLQSGSFTKAAESLRYSQSAVSQSIRSLEKELSVVLLERGRDGLVLTKDGEQYLPYIQAIVADEQALSQKQQEMQGLVHAKIRIGTFTSVSRNILPQLMKEFREVYPDVSFDLLQGDYNSIADDILSGKLDFGFVSPDFVHDLETVDLFQDTMMAVLPENHPLANKKSVSLKDLESEPFIELDEGESSVALEAFDKAGLKPHEFYKVTDDYSILSMIRLGLGYSLLYQTVLAGYSTGVAVLPIKEEFHRTIALAWRSYDTLPLAAQRFADMIRERTPLIVDEMEL